MTAVQCFLVIPATLGPVGAAGRRPVGSGVSGTRNVEASVARVLQRYADLLLIFLLKGPTRCDCRRGRRWNLQKPSLQMPLTPARRVTFMDVSSHCNAPMTVAVGALSSPRLTFVIFISVFREEPDAITRNARRCLGDRVIGHGSRCFCR